MGEENINQPFIELINTQWGFEKVITNNKKYLAKILYIVKGRYTSLKYHKIKHKTLYIQSGKIKVYFSDNVNETENAIKNSESVTGVHNTLMTINNIAAKYELIKTLTLNRGDALCIPPNKPFLIIAIDESEVFEASTAENKDDVYTLIKGGMI